MWVFSQLPCVPDKSTTIMNESGSNMTGGIVHHIFTFQPSSWVGVSWCSSYHKVWLSYRGSQQEWWRILQGQPFWHYTHTHSFLWWTQYELFLLLLLRLYFILLFSDDVLMLWGLFMPFLRRRRRCETFEQKPLVVHHFGWYIFVFAFSHTFSLV